MRRRSFILISLGGLLAACGNPTGAPAPTAAPATALPATAAPTDRPPATSSAPTPAPATATALPATPPPTTGILARPLYLIENGQIARIATDGKTTSLLTSEQPFAEGVLAITELAVAPGDAALAYVLQGPNGNSLITTDADGQNRRVLLDNLAVASPSWSPDGSALAVQIANGDATDSRWQDGIWIVSVVSGEARLLRANDPIPTEGLADAWGYTPLSWSPDGARMLVGRYSLMVEMGEAAILNVASGELLLLEPPVGTADGVRVQSSDGQWNVDGSGVYVILRGAALAAPEPGLYLANASSGALSEIVSSRTAADRYRLIQAQFTGADDALYLLASEMDGPPADVEQALSAPASLYRADASGALEQITPEIFKLFGIPTLAPGGNGLIIPIEAENGGVNYLYLDASGATLQLPVEPRSDIRLP